MFKKSEGTLFFFPAMLPLVEMLPWLLSGIAAVSAFLIRTVGKRGAVLTSAALVTAALLVAAGIQSNYFRPAVKTSFLEAPEKLPVAKHFQSEAPADVSTNHGFLRARWARTPISSNLTSPLITGDLLINGTWDNTVIAYDLNNGRELWSLAKKSFASSITLASPELLLAGEGLHEDTSASLTAIELPSAKVLWQREFAGHLEIESAVENGKIFVSTGSGGLWCLDLRTGEAIWNKPLGHIDSTPMLLDNLAFAVYQKEDKAQESRLAAFKTDDGEIAWELALPGEPWGSPAFHPESATIFVTSGTGQIGRIKNSDKGWLHAVSYADRKLLWSTDLGGHPLFDKLFMDKLIFVATTRGAVMAVDVLSGEIKWRAEMGWELYAPPALSIKRGILAAITAQGNLRFFRAHDGQEMGQFDFNSEAYGSPVFFNDEIIVGVANKLGRFTF